MMCVDYLGSVLYVIRVCKYKLKKKGNIMAKKRKIARLIEDLGGASVVAQMAKVVRTAPYGWVNRKFVSSIVLEKILTEKPELDLDNYFEEEEDEQDKIGSST